MGRGIACEKGELALYPIESELDEVGKVGQASGFYRHDFDYQAINLIGILAKGVHMCTVAVYIAWHEVRRVLQVAAFTRSPALC